MFLRPTIILLFSQSKPVTHMVQLHAHPHLRTAYDVHEKPYNDCVNLFSSLSGLLTNGCRPITLTGVNLKKNHRKRKTLRGREYIPFTDGMSL
jgi:hypothetical protein